MTKHKGRDVTVLKEVPNDKEDKLVVRHSDGTQQTVNKKDISQEHTQQLSRHVPTSVVKDTPKEHKDNKKVK